MIIEPSDVERVTTVELADLVIALGAMLDDSSSGAGMVAFYRRLIVAIAGVIRDRRDPVAHLPVAQQLAYHATVVRHAGSLLGIGPEEPTGTAT